MMASDKKEFTSLENPSAPLYPTQTSITTETSTLTSQQQQQPQLQQSQHQAPPPPYYEPLPPLRPAQIQPGQNIFSYVGPHNMNISVGSSPSRLRCPNCQADIVTQTSHKSGCLSWAICGSICAIGLFAPCAWLGCQFIPFCIDSCKDVVHNCPNCKVYIGTFDRMK